MASALSPLHLFIPLLSIFSLQLCSCHRELDRDNGKESRSWMFLCGSWKRDMQHTMAGSTKCYYSVEVGHELYYRVKPVSYRVYEVRRKHREIIETDLADFRKNMAT